MTTDELRAKFEAWVEREYRGVSRRRRPDGRYKNITAQLMFESALLGHTSRDAEVEALKRDAERYRAIRQAFVEADEGFIEKITDVLRGRDCTAPEFDTAIDAAREKQP